MTKQDIYRSFAELGQYPPLSVIEQVQIDIKPLETPKNFFGIVDYFNKMAKTMDYKNKEQGAYKFEEEITHGEWAAKSSRSIAKIDVDTEEIIETYQSIYSAIISLGKKKQACGNLSVAAKKGTRAYGFRWRFV